MGPFSGSWFYWFWLGLRLQVTGVWLCRFVVVNCFGGFNSLTVLCFWLRLVRLDSYCLTGYGFWCLGRYAAVYFDAGKRLNRFIVVNWFLGFRQVQSLGLLFWVLFFWFVIFPPFLLFYCSLFYIFVCQASKPVSLFFSLFFSLQYNLKQ